ncbi:MAG: DUF4968 domain-containing protein [Melioribacteraceae bacterium]|nr:DUF4968 domain-containing protein [Melioribacteraceae bacterium]
MKKTTAFIIIILYSFFSLTLYAGFEKKDDHVIIELKKKTPSEAQRLKIQICSDNIIHVIATPVESFSERPSLMVSKKNWDKVHWRVEESNGFIIISTDKLTVKINSDNGHIEFIDSEGKILLKEKDGNSRIFTLTEEMGEKVYNIQQLFHSPPAEAYYGLGAHQNNVFNYKGKDVDLWQLNIINAIPFLVSSNNYGILWDNNSHTKFGDIRDYQSISSLKLYDKTGREGGLSADYYKDREYKYIFTSRKESRIEHEYLDVNDEYPEGFGSNVAAVRWSGEIESAVGGIHKFRLYASSYIRMWLNGKLIADAWRQNWLPWTHLTELKMEPGKKYKIKIEWIPMGGYIGLKYLTPHDEIYNKNISLWSEVADQIDYYFVHGKSVDEIIRGYRTITGKAPMMPKWAMGLWQCRERYKSQEELLSVVKEFRKRNIPLDNIVQDWFYWEEDKWGDHEFDPERFPDPEGMIQTLHDELNAKIMISVWPKFYVGTKNYEKFLRKGWLYTRNVEVGEKDWVGPGYVSTFYDPYSEGAGKLFWGLINDKLFSKGIDAWWLDATEPDIHSNLSSPEIKLRIGPTALGTSARYLNTYSLMNSKSVYEGQRNTDPDKRVFILTRSAFAGQQRYSAATWSGDIASRWYDLKAQIPAGLNFSLSGIPYWTTDIGGFAVEPRFVKPDKADLEEWRELNTRWFQFGTFCPLFRVHGQFPYREMFNIAPDDHPAYKSMLAYDKLRYRLMPYIYSLTGAVTQQDYTIMRALVMDFGNDENVLNIGDQFMFGPALMINPVTEYKARERKVYLPADTGWYELNSGKYLQGGKKITVNAPYEKIPVFVKAGSIIPCGPDIQFVDEKPADSLRVFIYTGSDGCFNLYEDENINYNYEKGKFSIIPFIYDEETISLTIGDRQGHFDGMLKERTIEIIWITRDRAIGLDFRIEPDTTLLYDGSRQVISSKN